MCLLHYNNNSISKTNYNLLSFHSVRLDALRLTYTMLFGLLSSTRDGHLLLLSPFLEEKNTKAEKNEVICPGMSKTIPGPSLFQCVLFG